VLLPLLLLRNPNPTIFILNKNQEKKRFLHHNVEGIGMWKICIYSTRWKVKKKFRAQKLHNHCTMGIFILFYLFCTDLNSISHHGQRWEWFLKKRMLKKSWSQN
jgi:hypothetical protein